MKHLRNPKNKIFEAIIKNGTALYFGQILNEQQADNYFKILLNTINWKHDELFIFGKRIITKREVAWYGNPGLQYSYSNTTKTALPWTTELLELKKLTEKITDATYNSCLLNLYHNGQEGMAWHSDNEKELLKNGSIASLSLGAERKFSFKHKTTKETVSVLLEHGSLLEMKGGTQQHWQHRLPPTKKVTEPRINITFRTIMSKVG